MPYQRRLHARPTEVTQAAPTGLHQLHLSSARDKGYFYVPRNYRPQKPSPLVLLLHGADGHAHHGLGLLQHLADAAGMILVAPTSTSRTWDLIAKKAYGPDLMLVDQSLAHVCREYAVDPTHLAIGGFSDGASYALSLGIANGDLFTHAMAFSPGFLPAAEERGNPRFFMTHGTQDRILPISACSRRIVPRLRQSGYDVTYHEFEGPHIVPPAMARAAVAWFIGKRVTG